MTFDAVRKIALALPGTEESTSYGTPAFKVRGKMFVRLRPEKDVLVVMIDSADREHLVTAAPAIFHLTPHYLNSPFVLVRMAAITPASMTRLLGAAWRLAAPNSLRRQVSDADMAKNYS